MDAQRFDSVLPVQDHTSVVALTRPSDDSVQQRVRDDLNEQLAMFLPM